MLKSSSCSIKTIVTFLNIIIGFVILNLFPVPSFICCVISLVMYLEKKAHEVEFDLI